MFALRRSKWKARLLPAAVTFALAFNVPRYFELTAERNLNETFVVSTGRRKAVPPLVKSRQLVYLQGIRTHPLIIRPDLLEVKSVGCQVISRAL